MGPTKMYTCLSENDLLEMRQSAYRKNHSTETALLSIVDGLLRNADDRLVSVLALLDLSAAFDTLDHPISLQMLETTFGISGTLLHWFASYLEGREQSVMVDNVLSSPSPFQFGFCPQGSVLGPVVFTLYSQPLSDLICRYECNSLMIPSCQRGLLPINFSLFSVISRPALTVLYAGCTATSSN